MLAKGVYGKGSMHVEGGHAWQGVCMAGACMEGSSMAGSMHGRRVCMQERRPLKWAVRILL